MSNLFGMLLNKVRMMKETETEFARQRLWDRQNVPRAKRHKTEGYEIRTSERTDRGGVVTVKLEMWQRVDVECVKIEPQVVASTVQLDKNADDDWL